MWERSTVELKGYVEGLTSALNLLRNVKEYGLDECIKELQLLKSLHSDRLEKKLHCDSPPDIL